MVKFGLLCISTSGHSAANVGWLCHFEAIRFRIKARSHQQQVAATVAEGQAIAGRYKKLENFLYRNHLSQVAVDSQYSLYSEPALSCKILFIAHLLKLNKDRRKCEKSDVGISVTRLGNLLDFGPLATINFPKSPTVLGNFCKDVKIYSFSSDTSFGQLLQTFGNFF